ELSHRTLGLLQSHAFCSCLRQQCANSGHEHSTIRLREGSDAEYGGRRRARSDFGSSLFKFVWRQRIHLQGDDEVMINSATDNCPREQNEQIHTKTDTKRYESSQRVK